MKTPTWITESEVQWDEDREDPLYPDDDIISPEEIGEP
jgi:hypothetical protein